MHPVSALTPATTNPLTPQRMKNEMTTPRPWKCSNPIRSDSDSCNIYCDDSKDGVDNWIFAATAVKLPDARLIVSAVNQFDALNAVCNAAAEVNRTKRFHGSHGARVAAFEALEKALSTLNAIKAEMV